MLRVRSPKRRASSVPRLTFAPPPRSSLLGFHRVLSVALRDQVIDHERTAQNARHTPTSTCQRPGPACKRLCLLTAFVFPSLLPAQVSVVRDLPPCGLSRVTAGRTRRVSRWQIPRNALSRPAKSRGKNGGSGFSPHWQSVAAPRWK